MTGAGRRITAIAVPRLGSVAGRIRESDIAAIRERNRLDDIVGEYVALRPAGGGALKGLCPFHDEKTPSFNVRPEHGTFHCFGCGEGGDVIKFVMQIEYLGFVESVERLADRAGLRLTYVGGDGGQPKRDKGSRARLVEANKAAQVFYAGQLRSDAARPAREFLSERGFDGEAAAKFGCGFAPAGWDTLTKHLLSHGFQLEELYEAQLAKEGRRGPIDRFHRRLMWPIKDLGGDVVGFGARRLFDDDLIEAKYLNTGESPLYKKSQVLFGIDHAKREIARKHQVVVVEGYTDVMAMHQAGVSTAVASSGTAFGNDHMAALRRLLMDDDTFRGEVIFTFDGDEAGRKAALKAFEGEQTFAGQTYIAVAAEGMDPCELRLNNGDAAVRDMVARRTPLFEFAIRRMLSDHDLDSVDGQVAALRRTVPLVARIKDRASRDGYAAKLAWWAGWQDEAMVVRRVRESSANPSSQSTGRKQGGSVATEPGDSHSGGLERPDPSDVRYRAQRETLKAALQEPAVAGPEYDALSAEAFTHPAYRAVHCAVVAAGGASAGLAGPALLDAASEQSSDPTARSLLSELSVETLQTKDGESVRYVSSVLAAVQKGLVGRQISEIKSKLQRMSPMDDEDEYRALFGDLVALEQYHKGLVEQSHGSVG